MVSFESTQRDFIRKQIGELSEQARIGRVVEVYEHTAGDDDSNFEVDVNFPEEDKQHRQIPLLQPGRNSISIPQVGDKVMVEYRAGERNPPVARDIAYTNIDRAPLGKSGMWRKKFVSGSSPAGDGDVHVTGYTNWDGDPTTTDKDSLSADEAWVQIAKHADTDGRPSDPPMKIEMYDSPTNNSSKMVLDGNAVDGDSGKGLTVELDLKAGTVRVDGENGGDSYQLEIDVKNETAKISGDGTNEMGANFDFVNDTFTIIDGMGYGIVSDGAGNFTWHHETVDFSEGTTTSL